MPFPSNSAQPRPTAHLGARLRRELSYQVLLLLRGLTRLRVQTLLCLRQQGTSSACVLRFSRFARKTQHRNVQVPQ